MPVAITLQTIPSGSQRTSTIAAGEEADKNDFAVLISLDGNGTGLTESNLSVSHGSIVAVEGSNSVWKATVRPPETAVAALTFTVAANAFSEGNTETTLDIRVSTQFPDTDAETTTSLFTHSVSGEKGIAVTPTRILISHNSGISKFTHGGTLQSSEEITASLSLTTNIDVINGDILIRHRSGGTQLATRRHTESAGALTEVAEYTNLRGYGITHTRLGFATIDTTSRDILIQAYGETEIETHEWDGTTSAGSFIAIAHQDDILYFSKLDTSVFPRIGIAEITPDAEIRYRKDLNVEYLASSGVNDIFAFQNTLYILSGQDNVQTLDIRPYRSLSKNTKTTIYPVFATNGETIPLKQYCPDAKEFTFSVGFDKPDYLSINSNNEIAITSNAVTETTPVFMQVTGINYIDSADFSFYLVIIPATASEWRDVDNLSMKANSSYDLHQIVDADSIAFETGETQPTGSSIANGIFTIDTTGGTARFTATKGSLTTDKAIDIDVIQAPDPDNFSDITRYKIEIAGIDVTADYTKNSQIRITKSLDDVELTRYRAHSITFSLKNDGEKYTPDLAGNFWETNSLNPGGYQEEIKVYRESWINNAWVESLLFIGIIQGQVERISAVEVSFTAEDISVELERSFITDFGTLEKWDRLRQQSDEATFEGVYVPEGSLLPIQPHVAKAWSDRTALTLRRLQIPTQGPPLSNTGHLTANDFRTSGGFLENPPLLNFKTSPRSEDVMFLLNQLALTESVYNTDIQLPEVELGDPTIFNRGSVPLSIEKSRITRLMTDWVHDSTNDRILMPLSNPEGHIADILVQYNLNSDSFRTLYTFGKNIKAHRIARRDATNYYILTSGAISQDRSAATLPRHADATGYAFDSSAEGSLVRVHHYNANTNALTEHVAEDNARPPQLGIHYFVGFENDLYIDEFEGIVPSNRAAFKWYSGNLYYRYATPSEFGVARVNASGTTSEMIDQTTLNYQNHLNFAFDITSGGDIYFVYSVGDADESSLVIKRRTSSGTETTRLTETQDLADLTVIDEQGGVHLGAHECLFHNNDLYILAIIGRADYDEDNDETTRSRTKSAGMTLYKCNVTASNPTLTTIETWDFATHSACNLVVHDGVVHFMEHPPTATQYKPINPDLDGYWSDADEMQTMGYNVLPEALGALKKIESDGSVTELGNLWYDERAYNQALTRALSFEDELHIMMGYGNPDAVLRYNSLASKADNFVHLVFGNKLNYIPPDFQPTGTVFSKLAEIARQVGATVSFDGKIISVIDRRPYRAKVDGATGTGTGNLDFDEQNKAFPSSGYLRIDDEFIGYTGISSGAFTGITRGALGTEIVDHADNVGILHVNALFSERDILDITPSTDTTRHHNIVRDGNNIFEVSADDANIAQYRKQPYTLDLGLTRNEVAWIETMFRQYLSELETLGKLFDIKLRARKNAFALDLGQRIGLRFSDQVYVVRIEMLSDTANVIGIKGRSVADIQG